MAAERNVARRAWAAVLAALVASSAGTPAPAQEPTLSSGPSDCQAPGATIVASAALPNISNALKDRKRIRILAIGATSIARRDSAPGGYHAIIAEFLERTFKGADVEIFNRGVSGELARDAAERIKNEVGLTEADLVLWQVGTPDAMAQVPVDEFKTAVTDAVTWLKERNTDVALIGMQYSRRMADDPYYQAMRVAVQEVAKEQAVLRIGRYDAVETIQKIRLQRGEPATETELTEAGYVCMAEYLARAIAIGLFARMRTPGASPSANPPAKAP
jgi:lysophospholipase L1-like esterase